MSRDDPISLRAVPDLSALGKLLEFATIEILDFLFSTGLALSALPQLAAVLVDYVWIMTVA